MSEETATPAAMDAKRAKAAKGANWFLAFPIDPADWFARVDAPPRGIRRFHSDDLHLTITFLGAVGEEKARAAWDALDASLAEVLPERARGRALDATLADVVPMGNPQRYSALSALLADGREVVESAMGALRVASRRAANLGEDRWPPKAHVTVARPSRKADERARSAALEWAKTLYLRDTPIRLDRVALYTWSPDRKERLFHIVAERAL